MNVADADWLGCDVAYSEPQETGVAVFNSEAFWFGFRCGLQGPSINALHTTLRIQEFREGSRRWFDDYCAGWMLGHAARVAARLDGLDVPDF